MAMILRGKHKGKTVDVSQWCNDWVTVYLGDKVIVCRITNLEFTVEEMYQILVAEDNGPLFHEFEKITNENKFRKRKVW